jgi:uncharacterized membrane protein YphA (DoxX/SURF4 family)
VQRLFSTFPGGWPGAGLLLLRAAAGLAAVLQGVAYLDDRGSIPLRIWVTGGLAIVTGISLLIGFLTPINAVVAGLGAIGLEFSWIPAPPVSLSAGWLSIVFVVVIAAAIVLLGPGAFSLDARLFGRREIIIPPASRPPQH